MPVQRVNQVNDLTAPNSFCAFLNDSSSPHDIALKSFVDLFTSSAMVVLTKLDLNAISFAQKRPSHVHSFLPSVGGN